MCYTLHGSSDRKIRKCLTFLTPKRSDLYMSYAVVRMQKMKSHDLKGIQFHNQRERESKTNDDIDKERSHENYDLKNDENINYNERVKNIIDSQKTGTRKTRKDAVLVNELLVTSDRDFTNNSFTRTASFLVFRVPVFCESIISFTRSLYFMFSSFCKSYFSCVRSLSISSFVLLSRSL